MIDLERRQRRLDSARFWIRAELFVALAIPVGVGFLFVAAPSSCMCPMFSEPPLLLQALPWLGGLGYVVGLVWMFRLSRPRVESDESSWRYRDF